MKRTLTLAAGILALGATAYFGSQLAAQHGAQPAQATALRNKIAVFNMSEVIKGYKRWQDFDNQRTASLKEQEGKFAKFKADIATKQEAMTRVTATDTAGRDKIEREIKAIQRQATELQEDLQRQYQKWEQDQVTTIYKEIEGVCNDIARAYNVELILHYTDPITPEEKYHPMNLARKLQSSGVTPIYMAGGIDISKWILDNLNKRYQASAAPAPGSGGTPNK